MATKRQVLDKLNDAFLILASSAIFANFSKTINETTKRTIANQKEVKRTAFDIDLSTIIFGALILSEITLLIENRKGSKEIKNIAQIYSPANAGNFVKKVNKVSISVFKGSPAGLNNNEKRLFDSMNDLRQKRSKTIARIIETQNQRFKRINKQITTDLSKKIIKDAKRLKFLPREEIERKLRAKYKDNQYRVTRIVETETHSLKEQVKQVDALSRGFNKKTWRTQADNRVRETHSKLQGKEVKISGEFNVGGEKARYPGDNRLSAGERINCRCYLIYS